MRLGPQEQEQQIMRLSRDKVNRLAHAVTDAMEAEDGVQCLQDHNVIRLKVRELLEDLLKKEKAIDGEARRKIESQRRTILEGSQEWDILYRKYYNEEVKKLGI